MMTAAASPAAGSGRRAPAFRLLDDFQAQYIKFAGREPRTLGELAIARADYEHRHRLAEIKAMAKKLALLDQLLPEIAERGIDLSRRTIYSWDSGKALSIPTGTFEKDDDKLYAVLLDLGFKEIERRDYFGRTDHVMLKHGRALVLRLEVSKSATEGGAA